jgi:tRNA G10  N-methylase Trm11
MGSAACETAIRFVLGHTACRTIVDPFCGQGSILAAANAHGLDAIGVELSRRRASRARVARHLADADADAAVDATDEPADD